MNYYARYEILRAVTRKKIVSFFLFVCLFIYLKIDNKFCKTYWI